MGIRCCEVVIDIKEFINAVDTEIYKKGEKIFEAGDPSDGFMYFVLEGKVQISKDESGIIELNPGEVFGEMGLVNNSDRAATVSIASRVARLARIDKAMFMKLSKINPLFLFQILKISIHRLSLLEEQIKEAENALHASE